MTAEPLRVSFPHETLAQFGEASGDRSPLHCDESYASRTPFGQAIIHGSLTLLAMVARTPLAAGSNPLALDAVYRQAVLPDRPYTIEMRSAEGGWKIELRDGDASFLTATLRAADPPAPAARPDRVPGPMAQESATPSAEELAGAPSAFSEYRPDIEGLMSLAHTYSGGGEVSPALAAALGWISYVPGMELPGRHSMCRRVKLRVEGGGEAAESLASASRVEMFDDRTALMRVSGALFRDGAALAESTLGIHWRRNPETDT